MLAAAARALFVALATIERRHEFATMAALGARLREIRSFVWSEAALVLIAAVVLAAGLGWLLLRDAGRDAPARVRPAPRQPRRALALPRRARAGALAGSVLAGAVAARALARMPLGAILREQ